MPALEQAQERAVAHGDGALLLLGPAGTGKTEVLARRLARLVSEGTAPEQVLIVASTRATARRLHARAEALLDGPFEELWIGTWDAICERLLRDHSEAAGLDPFFDVLGPAERLAMLLDRFDELPLRRHEIRGNPARLLALLLARIDELKAAGTGPEAVEAQAREHEGAAGDEAGREAARREREFAELYATHDRILTAAGSLDRGDVFLALNCLLSERADARREIATRFRFLMVDELEDATPAQRGILAALLTDNPNHVYASEGQDPPSEDGETIVLDHCFREPAVRFWRCSNERAQAQAVAREVEALLAGDTPAAAICVLVDEPARRGGAVEAAMEERGIPFHLSGPTALFRRPEVRDAIAWLRALVDPEDSAAVARVLTRPPIELRSAELAQLTTIARRRKLNMVAACEAALGSPQIPPEARERIQAFLKLYRAASGALEERRADVFVRRLIERVGLRRQRLFAAQPEVAERLIALSRLAELAAAWARREPHGSTRGFVRFLSAVADAGVEAAGGEEPPSPDAVLGLDFKAVKGMEFGHVFALGLEHDSDVARIGNPAGTGLVLSRVEHAEDGTTHPPPFFEEALAEAGASEEAHEEELFGPAEGLHATYRMLREEVLEASWKAGRELSEPRLDTAIDVNRAIARYLELLKLAALVQRPGEEATADAIDAVNGLLRQVASAEQQAELEASSLDSYLLDSERGRDGRRESIATRKEPSLEAFLPLRSDGALNLSASDLGLYLTCPLKYKFARVFAIPQEPTINQRFGILIHNVLERFHKEDSEDKGLRQLMNLFEAGWRRGGFGATDDELQFRDRAREAMRLYWERESGAASKPVWLERKFDFEIGDYHVRGRVDRVDLLPGGGYELIDYKTGERKTEAEMESDLQLALYRLAAREAWGVEAKAGSYYYVLDAEKVATPIKPDDAERVERTVLEVGEGVLKQDFEPQPSPEVCSWCDYRLICPAAEG